MKQNSNKSFGNEGEDVASGFLQTHGYEIIERNYRFHKGEIDIVAKDIESNYLVFVEVKSRKSLEYGEPEYAITPAKAKQLKRMANYYILENHVKNVDCRLDVITVLFTPTNPPLINHYKNAIS
ncbi:MAG: YraN family protein [Ignavibacteriaceae bacterium]|nr:YraN family protein [Ignavibacteriaceae bacterium]